MSDYGRNETIEETAELVNSYGGIGIPVCVDHTNINITSLALTPGYLRSEAMLDSFEVSGENWQDGIEKDPNLSNSETPFYVGRAVTELASDPNVAEKSGKVLSSGWLAREYGFTDIDGTQPIGYWYGFAFIY